MKIGIIVYSETGNTYSVATKLKERLSKEKHDVELERIEIEDQGKARELETKFKTIPKVDKYDVLIFASPVQAFTLSIVMKNYLKQLKLLDGKRVLCFVTEGFSYPWMGGNRAIKKMTETCKQKNGMIVDTAVINWGNKQKETMIADMIQKFSQILK